MMNYGTNEAKSIYNRDEQTIRNWAIEFAEFLSPLANPEKGRNRAFTEDDMRVLDLIASLKDEGKQFIDIHAALKAGQRGKSPVVSPQEIRALSTGQIERRLTVEIQRLKDELALAQEQLNDIEAIRSDNARLEERIKLREEQVETLMEQLKESQSKLEGLFREVGKAYHEGYMAALKDQDQADDN